MSEAHPLFPTEHEDDEPAEVGWIHVTRLEAGGAKWAPRLFGADELDSLETLNELYGGGPYELVARSHDKKRLTARKRYTLPGRQLPLDGSQPEAASPPMGHVSQAVAPPQSDQVMIAVLQLMAQQQQSNTQLMIAMLTRGDQSSQQHVQSMQQLHDRFAQSQSELFRTMLEAQRSSGGGGGDRETFMQGIEFAQELAAGAAEARGNDDGGGDIKDIIEGLGAFAQMQAAERAAELERLRAANRASRQQQQQPPPPNGAGGGQS